MCLVKSKDFVTVAMFPPSSFLSPFPNSSAITGLTHDTEINIELLLALPTKLAIWLLKWQETQKEKDWDMQKRFLISVHILLSYFLCWFFKTGSQNVAQTTSNSVFSCLCLLTARIASTPYQAWLFSFCSQVYFFITVIVYLCSIIKSYH
jgi:hypothetical protein